MSKLIEKTDMFTPDCQTPAKPPKKTLNPELEVLQQPEVTVIPSTQAATMKANTQLVLSDEMVNRISEGVYNQVFDSDRTSSMRKIDWLASVTKSQPPKSVIVQKRDEDLEEQKMPHNHAQTAVYGS